MDLISFILLIAGVLFIIGFALPLIRLAVSIRKDLKSLNEPFVMRQGDL